MVVFLNGRFLEESEALVPISDRGWLYGDGLFETIRVRDSRPMWWGRHLDRFVEGAAFLRIQPPWSPAELREFAEELIRRNQSPEAVLRITMSRGSGPRGYSPAAAIHPTLAMTLDGPIAPRDSIRLVTAGLRVLAEDPLTRHKTTSKLLQVMARGEAESRGGDEALLLNSEGHVAETAGGNLFWVDAGMVCTPPLREGALPGVTRSVVRELCDRRGCRNLEKPVRAEDLGAAEGVFVTNSVWGMLRVTELDGRPLGQSPLVAELMEAYAELEAGA